MLIVYVIGCPVVAFIILYKFRTKLNDPKVLMYIILLYQGLRHQVYYWEMINSLRKFALLCFHVFIPDKLRIMKAMCGVLILFIISMLQSRMKPYKIKLISSLGSLFQIIV